MDNIGLDPLVCHKQSLTKINSTHENASQNPRYSHFAFHVSYDLHQPCDGFRRPFKSNRAFLELKCELSWSTLIYTD